MTSFISIFNNRFTLLVISLVLSMGVSLAYTLALNPEVRFWKSAYKVKEAHARELERQGVRKHVFGGGSSCAFQVDTGTLERELGLPSVNVGMHAGMGVGALTALAARLAAPQDQLVMQWEPGLITSDSDIPALGYQTLAATGAIWESESRRFLPDFSFSSALLAMRPGLYHSATIAVKVAINAPLYRYGIEEVDPTGHLTTEVRRQIVAQPPVRHSFQDASYLHKFNAIWPPDRPIVYLLPDAYVHEPDVELARRYNTEFLQEIEQTGLRTVHTQALGAVPTATEFADTGLHMTAEASRKKAFEIARVLGD